MRRFALAEAGAIVLLVSALNVAAAVSQTQDYDVSADEMSAVCNTEYV